MKLDDLNYLGQQIEEKIEKYEFRELLLSEEFKSEFQKHLASNSRDKITFENYTAIVSTANGLKIIFPNQWFYIASFFYDFLNSLWKYKGLVNQLNIPKELINKTRGNIMDEEVKQELNSVLENKKDLLFFEKFLTDYKWWYGSKTIDRGDFFVSPVLSLAKVINVSHSYLADLAFYFSKNKNLTDIIQKDYNRFINNTNSLNDKKISVTNFNNLKNEFADWLISKNRQRANYFSTAFGSNRDRFLEHLTKYESIYFNEFGTHIFGTSLDLKDFISELENNLYQDSGEFFVFSDKTSNHMPRAILGKNNYLKFLKELLNENKISSANSPRVNPANKIYYGAPGTGKSYRVTQDLKEVDTIFQKRITFHPEYDNTSFVGGYKPITDKNGEVKYEFVPQIFTNIFVEACNDPAHQYYLIIEEINRGNCAEIFGELFQLLDRDENYKITPSDELIYYLNNNISDSKFYIDGQMLLPDNLSILATMNTSDQSLFPMDSAFKRRWEWEFIPICYETTDEFGKTNSSYDFVIDINDGKKYSWIEFIEKINLDHINENKSLGMDKCIGNYFIKPDNGKTISLRPFINKVIFYLWNDVFKDESNNVFEENTSYENFFPIETKGKMKIKELFERIELSPIKSSPLEIVEEEAPVRNVAEDREEIGS